MRLISVAGQDSFRCLNESKALGALFRSLRLAEEALRLTCKLAISFLAQAAFAEIRNFRKGQIAFAFTFLHE
jgi:hypothetical protein